MDESSLGHTPDTPDELKVLFLMTGRLRPEGGQDQRLLDRIVFHNLRPPTEAERSNGFRKHPSKWKWSDWMQFRAQCIDVSRGTDTRHLAGLPKLEETSRVSQRLQGRPAGPCRR